jgi:diguanylate cyclase (GGDEF)-like protein/PAS domain S-box-containing protein
MTLRLPAYNLTSAEVGTRQSTEASTDPFILPVENWIMTATPEKQGTTRPAEWRLGALGFTLAALLSGVVIWRSEVRQTAFEQGGVTRLAATHAAAIQRNIERALSATYPLAALVRLSNGKPSDFAELATQMLPYYQGASALALAPDGVIKQIVPLRGNEKAIGYNLLKDPARDKEAFLSRQTGALTLAGPFPLVQGGFAAAGRLPVYLEKNNRPQDFWGFVSVLVRFPETLDTAGLDQLPNNGLAFELWRIHPDTQQRQIIESSGGPLQDPVQVPIAVPNATWTLSVAPIDGWQNPQRFAAKIAAALIFSLLIGYTSHLAARQRTYRHTLRTRIDKATNELRVANQALRESEAHYRALFADSAVVMLLVDPADGKIVEGNAAATTYYGYPPNRLREMNIREIYPRMVTSLDEQMKQSTGQEQAYFDCQHRLANGELRNVQVSSGPIVVDGRPLLLSTIQDVTERKRIEARMREALVVFTTSSQGIMTTDATGLITAINPAFSSITGYSPEDVIGHRPSMFKSNRHDSAFYQTLWKALQTQCYWEGEIWNRRQNGQIYPQWMTISSVRNPQGRVIEYVAMFSDITERKQHEEAMWRQANFDGLTGLANRNLLADRLERALAQARRKGKKVGVAFLDLDGFKWINDTLGHDIGDQLLVEVGHRLGHCVREQDTAARLGGDEFMAVIHDLGDVQDMVGIGEKLVGVLRDPFTLAGGQHQLSGSIGITVFPDDGEDVQTLLKNADIAMYKAKQGGKNRYQFYARHMQVDAQARMQMESDLRVAVENKNFVLHYQPIVDADSGELVGAEALIRWPRPDGSLASPLEFVPVAEDCGLIVPIGEWVLREAARQWHDWHLKGYLPLRLSVNVSGVQFREPSLNKCIEEVLTEFAIAPGFLVLEITESVLMDGSREAESRMREIKALGVGYSLDDFGTGFSSLSYLKRFPVDIVKIDRSFVNDCPDDHNDAHLVEAIVNMAHSLNLRVTAEGVETEEQLEFLRDLGCDYLQGFLVGRPLPPEAFEVLIRRRQLLLPTDGATFEESRFLAALRQDELDVDDWLTRLFGGRSPELLDFADRRHWQSRGLDLRQAVQAHLDWRQRLNTFISTGSEAAMINIADAGIVDCCPLGQWITEHRSSGAGCFAKLDAAHQAFHRLAGKIVSDHRHGHRSLARRTLTSVAFRRASRDVVTALIDCYREEGTPTEKVF